MRVGSNQSSVFIARLSRPWRAKAGLLPRRAFRGASAVELALLFPFIMAIFFGIVEFAFVLYDKAVITNAAREGARAGIVLRNPRLNRSQITNIAQQYCANNMISIVGGSVCSASNDAPVNTDPAAGGTVPGAGARLTVNVDYTYNGTALLALYQIMAGPIQLRSTAVMEYEQ